MRNLKQILENYVPSNLTKLGGKENENQLDAKLEEIRRELTPFVTARTKQIKLFFILFVGLALLSIIIALLAVFVDVFKDNNTIQIIASIFTIAGVAPLTFLLNVFTWKKERDDAQMLLKMIDSLNAATFQSVLIVIATMLKK
jgi:hypothetical protein